jgi:preprotein translocase subunit SecA
VINKQRERWLRPVITDEGGAAGPVRRPAARRAAPLILNEPGEPVGAFAGAARAAGRAAAAPSPFAPRSVRAGGDDAPIKTMRREEPKVGRNDPCPCGSGKKYKKCHGSGVS